MLRLEIELQNERNIAQEVCQYLPSKTNKQIRDKRADTTYKAQREERLNSCPQKELENTMWEDGNEGAEVTLSERADLDGPTKQRKGSWY
jgi:hypothetical protein